MIFGICKWLAQRYGDRNHYHVRDEDGYWYRVEYWEWLSEAGRYVTYHEESLDQPAWVELGSWRAAFIQERGGRTRVSFVNRPFSGYWHKSWGWLHLSWSSWDNILTIGLPGWDRALDLFGRWRWYKPSEEIPF